MSAKEKKTGPEKQQEIEDSLELQHEETASPEVDNDLRSTIDRLQRLQAEFENFRRRGLRERQEAFQYGHQNLVKDLLSAVDNLERAVEHSENSAGGDLQNLLQGVELVLRELLGALGMHGVRVIEAANEPFDPAVHEAMSQFTDPSVPTNTVVQVLQKGYQLRDRLLRPARVIVSRMPDDEPVFGGANSGSDDEQ